MKRRVVITGMGMVSPVGNTVPEAWQAVVEGKSGISVVEEWRDQLWAGEPIGVTIGGAVRNFLAEDHVHPKKDVRRMGRFIHFALAASQEAWKQAMLPDRLEDEQAKGAGAVIGVGMLGLDVLLANYETLQHKGARRVSAFFIPGTISNLAAGQVAMRFNLKNANWCVVSACASGTHAIGEAFTQIREGRANLMLAGGAESTMHPLAVAGFDSMHALCASKNEAPTKASRPFDRDRDGFVMGEGAGMVVLESLEHAQARGAPIIAEVIGYGSTCDAHHITAPSPEGEGAQRAMRQALQMATVSPSDVQYINAHGTSTQLNDKYETDAIKAVFGSHARSLMISSTKSMTGHLLGAAGGVEAVFTAKALQAGILPPTVNLEHPDPECDLDYIPNQAREKKISVAMSNSFGFGGANAVLLMRRI